LLFSIPVTVGCPFKRSPIEVARVLGGNLDAAITTVNRARRVSFFRDGRPAP
jgi:hypothetical protein